MPTPQELAQIAEQYDDEQWFEFLNQLDDVSRRRRRTRRNKPEAPIPTRTEKDQMALWIARKHLAADSAIRKILYLPQGAPADEIRLLEVNDRMSLPDEEAGKIEPMEFGLNIQDAPFQLFVADITSEQLDAIRDSRLALPEGWIFEAPITTARRA